MWEALKEWGVGIGAGIIMFGIIAMLTRRKEEPVVDINTSLPDVEKAAAQHEAIVEQHRAVIEKVTTPIPQTKAPTIDAAIEEWKTV